MREGGQCYHRGTDAERNGQCPHPAHMAVARTGTPIGRNGIGNRHGSPHAIGDKDVGKP